MDTFTVTHLEVPIGTVELPVDRARVGGDLDMLPAASSVAPWLAAVAGGMSALTLLDLPWNAMPPEDAVAAPMLAPFLRAASLQFELRDSQGRLVPAVLVRVADLGRGRLHVRVHFRHSAAGTPASLPVEPVGGGARQPAA